MRVDAECRDASTDAACCPAPTSTVAEPVRTSPQALCEVMLNVLGRDNRLRSIYVRRRWQGLVTDIDLVSVDQRWRR